MNWFGEEQIKDGCQQPDTLIFLYELEPVFGEELDVQHSVYM